MNISKWDERVHIWMEFYNVIRIWSHRSNDCRRSVSASLITSWIKKILKIHGLFLLETHSWRGGKKACVHRRSNKLVYKVANGARSSHFESHGAGEIKGLKNILLVVCLCNGVISPMWQMIKSTKVPHTLCSPTLKNVHNWRGWNYLTLPTHTSSMQATWSGFR